MYLKEQTNYYAARNPVKPHNVSDVFFCVKTQYKWQKSFQYQYR